MENKKTKGFEVCEVCGREFPVTMEEHYVGREFGRVNPDTGAVNSAPFLWDCFDCPHCGCQNRIQPRLYLTDILGHKIVHIGNQEDDE